MTWSTKNFRCYLHSRCGCFTSFLHIYTDRMRMYISTIVTFIIAFYVYVCMYVYGAAYNIHLHLALRKSLHFSSRAAPRRTAAPPRCNSIPHHALKTLFPDSQERVFPEAYVSEGSIIRPVV